MTGVDPAPAMLELARRKPYGRGVDWVHAGAQSYRAARRFDLIVMTGHAFQVLLTDEDVLAAMDTMRTHLKPDGRLVFESRNPDFDWAGTWQYDRSFSLKTGDVTVTRRLLAVEDDRISFEIRYRFADEELVSASTIRFLSASAICRHLKSSGLEVDALFGDWDRTPFDEAASAEMIFLAQAAA